MDETLILSKFDKLVNSDLVLYDQNQETVQHVDGELEVSFGLSDEAGLLLNKSTLVSIPAYFGTCQEARARTAVIGKECRSQRRQS